LLPFYFAIKYLKTTLVINLSIRLIKRTQEEEEEEKEVEKEEEESGNLLRLRENFEIILEFDPPGN